MSSAKHGNDAIDLNKPYEENEIRLKGIFGFAIGLVALIVITFALMWAFLGTLRDYFKVSDNDKNPMAMSDRERLPPEPRLQLAAGFGVESDKGRVNLELLAPSAEYKELRKQWEETWKHGRRDEKTGIMSIMPVEMAKEKFLAQNAKAKAGPEAEEAFKSAHSIISDSSAGRLASETRR